MVRGAHGQDGRDGIQLPSIRGHAFAVPGAVAPELARLTTEVYRNYQREKLAAAKLPPRANQPRRPVPERVGEPSVFRHVVYIIKENRTYDQVLGDLPQGNGDTNLCIFGERITPNQHKLVREFVLLDNTYCSGILSADGHQWATTAFATDYMEKSFAGFRAVIPMAWRNRTSTPWLIRPQDSSGTTRCGTANVARLR